MFIPRRKLPAQAEGKILLPLPPARVFLLLPDLVVKEQAETRVDQLHLLLLLPLEVLEEVPLLDLVVRAEAVVSRHATPVIRC